MAFQFETAHERHFVDVIGRSGPEFIAYIATRPIGDDCASPDILTLGTYSTSAEARSAVSVAMLAMTRVTR